MNIHDYLEKMRCIQENLLEYIEEDGGSDDYLEDLKKLFNSQNIQDNYHEFKSFLYLLLGISNNHHRNSTFFGKMRKIFQTIKNEIIQNLSNLEIFYIFKSNKRITLLLIEEQIIIVDRTIAFKLTNEKYIQYFLTEIQPFFDNEMKSKIQSKLDYNKIIKEIPEYFDEKRKIGENENYVCELIRNDSVEEFVSYVNRKNLSLESTISSTIYETNPYLLENKPKLIEYAAFFGSIQIFQFLKINQVELNPNLWFYSIHGQNPEIIHLLEENHIIPENNSFKKCLEESIKCHHIDFTNYILNNLQDQNEKNDFLCGLKYYNFEYIKIEDINILHLNDICKYDYFVFANELLKNDKIELNRKKISLNLLF